MNHTLGASEVFQYHLLVHQPVDGRIDPPPRADASKPLQFCAASAAIEVQGEILQEGRVDLGSNDGKLSGPQPDASRPRRQCHVIPG